MDDRPEVKLEKLKDLLGRPPVEEIIPGLLDAGFVIVGAVEGSGKTFLGLTMGAHIAAGKPWGGKKVKQGTVVYCIAEGVSFFPYRVATIFDKLRVRAKDQPFYVLPYSLNLSTEVDKGKVNPAAEALLAAILAAEAESGFPTRMVVFDTLNRYMPGGDENTVLLRRSPRLGSAGRSRLVQRKLRRGCAPGGREEAESLGAPRHARERLGVVSEPLPPVPLRRLRRPRGRRRTAVLQSPSRRLLEQSSRGLPHGVPRRDGVRGPRLREQHGPAGRR